MSDGTRPAGRTKILEIEPHHRPEKVSSSPEPIVLARTPARRKRLRQAVSAAFRDAAEKLAEGDRLACFPRGTFPPGLPYVPTVSDLLAHGLAERRRRSRAPRARSRRSDVAFGGEEAAAARLGAADPAHLRGRSSALSVRRDDEDSLLPDRSTGGAKDSPASREPELRSSEWFATGGDGGKNDRHVPRRGVLAGNSLHLFVGDAGESLESEESQVRRISFVPGPEVSDPLLLASTRLADWLRFFGPVPTRVLAETVGTELGR